MVAGLTISLDRVGELLRAIQELSNTRVMVGVPAETAGRREEGDPINNAELAYIHENGAPEVNIPARPFLVPGMRNSRKDVVRLFRTAARLALAGNRGGMDRALNAAGLAAQNAIKAKITEGPFQPLAAATIRNRLAKYKGRKDRNPRPLIDTGQLRQSIKYVIRQIKVRG